MMSTDLYSPLWTVSWLCIIFCLWDCWSIYPAYLQITLWSILNCLWQMTKVFFTTFCQATVSLMSGYKPQSNRQTELANQDLKTTLCCLAFCPGNSSLNCLCMHTKTLIHCNVASFGLNLNSITFRRRMWIKDANFMRKNMQHVTR